MPRLAAAALLVAAAVARGEDRPWESGEPRPFVAGRLEAGAHGRALLQGGFGRPHWTWAGAQGAAFVTTHTAGVEGAVRAALPFLDLQLALRRTRSFDRPLLAAAERHSEAELEGGNARLTVVDADLWGVVPVPGGLASWELEWVRPVGLGAGVHAFEETWQVAIAGRGAGAVRLGYLAGPFARARLGPVAEAVRLFGRNETVTRAGGALFVDLGRHLSLVAFALLPVDAPDRFATYTATYGTLALRYAFASGDPAPGFP
jgi:hypothetical protein